MAYRCLCTCGVRLHLACLQAVPSPTALCCCFCPVWQRFRFTTSVMYTVCVSCEFLTPRFPSHFLLLTAVSNVGRAVGLTTFVSTQPAFQQALCASGNMADLASKTQVRVVWSYRQGIDMACTDLGSVHWGAGVRCPVWQSSWPMASMGTPAFACPCYLLAVMAFCWQTPTGPIAPAASGPGVRALMPSSLPLNPTLRLTLSATGTPPCRPCRPSTCAWTRWPLPCQPPPTTSCATRRPSA